ncbi:hypothetical protein ACFX15_010735 [Malus domestica]
MARKAVLIGCNYAGTKAELKGCINDVKRMYSCLVDRYGFSEDDIQILSTPAPTPPPPKPSENTPTLPPPYPR